MHSLSQRLKSKVENGLMCLSWLPALGNSWIQGRETGLSIRLPFHGGDSGVNVE